MANNHSAPGLVRRQFLGQAGALALGGFTGAKLLAQNSARQYAGQDGSLIALEPPSWRQD